MFLVLTRVLAKTNGKTSANCCTANGGGVECTKGLTGVTSLQRHATVLGRTPEHLYFALSPTQLLQATATEGTIVSQPLCRRALHFTAT